MIPVYVFCLAVGGTLVGLALLTGGQELGWDDSLDNLDVEPEADIDTAHSVPLSVPLFSLRFWSFGGCFFGLTGLLLSWTRPAWPWLLVFGLALAIGLGVGSAAVWSLGLLRRRQANSLVTADDLLGLLGTVELSFDNQTRGRVRLPVKGSWIEWTALTDEAHPLTQGEEVLVVGVEGAVVRVSRSGEVDDGPTGSGTVAGAGRP